MQFRVVTPKNFELTCDQLGLAGMDRLMLLGVKLMNHNELYIIEMETFQRNVDAFKKQRQENIARQWDTEPTSVRVIDDQHYSVGPVSI